MKVFFVNGKAENVKRLADIWQEDGVRSLFPWYEGKFQKEKERQLRADALQTADAVVCFYDPDEGMPLFELGIACASYVPIFVLARTQDEGNAVNLLCEPMRGALRGEIHVAGGFDIDSFHVRGAQSALPLIRNVLSQSQDRTRGTFAQKQNAIEASWMHLFAEQFDPVESLIVADSLFFWCIDQVEEEGVRLLKRGEREQSRVMFDEVCPSLYAGARAFSRFMEMRFPGVFQRTELVISRKRWSFVAPDATPPSTEVTEATHSAAAATAPHGE